VQGGFTTVGKAIEDVRFRAALAEAMRLAALVNQYLTITQPWKLLKTDRTRAGTVLYSALCCIDDLKILLTPFLPFSSQRLHEALGYSGTIAGQPDFRSIAESGASHDVLTGDYATWTGRWAHTSLPPGQKLREPKALFKKLDDAVVEEELKRMEERAQSGSAH
jgi:methionyl-tRNA synthetase